jgi:hypothetical protein
LIISDDIRKHHIIELLFRAAGCPSNYFLPLYDDEEERRQSEMLFFGAADPTHTDKREESRKKDAEESRRLEMLFLAAGPTRAEKLEILRKNCYF